MFVKTLLLIASLALVSAAPQGRYDETTLGGFTYFCFDDVSKMVQGTYSGVGFFEGVYDSSANTVTGDLFEAEGSSVFVGTFMLQGSDANFMAFTGTWESVDNSSDIGAWDATRTSTTAPTPDKCLQFAADPFAPTAPQDMVGEWIAQGYPLTLDSCEGAVGSENFIIAFDHQQPNDFILGRQTCETVGNNTVCAVDAHSTGAGGDISILCRTSGDGMAAAFYVFNNAYTQAFTELLDEAVYDATICEDKLAALWVGTWTDDMGGVTDICTEAATGKVQGVYSNVGFVTGEISGGEVVGTMFESDSVDGVDTEGAVVFIGDFVMSMDKYGAVWGSWVDQSDATSTGVWNTTNINHDVPTPAQCLQSTTDLFAVTAPGTDLVGVWTGFSYLSALDNKNVNINACPVVGFYDAEFNMTVGTTVSGGTGSCDTAAGLTFCSAGLTMDGGDMGSMITRTTTTGMVGMTTVVGDHMVGRSLILVESSVAPTCPVIPHNAASTQVPTLLSALVASIAMVFVSMM